MRKAEATLGSRFLEGMRRLFAQMRMAEYALDNEAVL